VRRAAIAVPRRLPTTAAVASTAPQRSVVVAAAPLRWRPAAAVGMPVLVGRAAAPTLVTSLRRSYATSMSRAAVPTRSKKLPHRRLTVSRFPGMLFYLLQTAVVAAQAARPAAMACPGCK